jgi:hypothetical protein
MDESEAKMSKNLKSH